MTEDQFSYEAFTEKIFGFIDHKEKIDRMEKNLAPLKNADVSDRIADLCIKLMGKEHREDI